MPQERRTAHSFLPHAKDAYHSPSLSALQQMQHELGAAALTLQLVRMRPPLRPRARERRVQRAKEKSPQHSVAPFLFNPRFQCGEDIFKPQVNCQRSAAVLHSLHDLREPGALPGLLINLSTPSFPCVCDALIHPAADDGESLGSDCFTLLRLDVPALKGCLTTRTT